LNYNINILLLKQIKLIKADWKYRYAGLMTLSSTAEGAHKQMETYLDQMVDFIIGFLKDSVCLKILFEKKLIKH